VYEATTKCLIDSVLTGYNATVFAYGPTGHDVLCVIYWMGVIKINQGVMIYMYSHSTT